MARSTPVIIRNLPGEFTIVIRSPHGTCTCKVVKIIRTGNLATFSVGRVKAATPYEDRSNGDHANNEENLK